MVEIHDSCMYYDMHLYGKINKGIRIVQKKDTAESDIINLYNMKGNL